MLLMYYLYIIQYYMNNITMHFNSNDTKLDTVAWVRPLQIHAELFFNSVVGNSLCNTL